MGDIHFFDTEIAAKYGVNAAVIFQNLYYWSKHNKANNTHFYDGRYWTYNSIKAFKDLFPYMGERAIRNALNTLIEKGLVISGNFNKSAYDRTLWYSITDAGYNIIRNSSMDLAETSNGDVQKVEPIPDRNTDNKNSNKDTVSQEDVDRVVEAWNSLGLTKIRKVPQNTERYKNLTARIKEYGIDDVLEAINNIRNSRFLKGSNENHWKISFDWFVRPNRFPRVLEGNYDDGKEDLF